MESTQQGCSTLKIQLRNAYESMETAAGHVKIFRPGSGTGWNGFLGGYALADESISLYLRTGPVFRRGRKQTKKWKKCWQPGMETRLRALLIPTSAA